MSTRKLRYLQYLINLVVTLPGFTPHHLGSRHLTRLTTLDNKDIFAVQSKPYTMSVPLSDAFKQASDVDSKKFPKTPENDDLLIVRSLTQTIDEHHR